jgi:hypothetical protein
MKARALRHFGLTLPVAAVCVGLFGLLRLGRQFPGAAESPGLLVPFFLPVLALALEAGAFVALSVAQLGALATTPAAAGEGSRQRVRETWLLLTLLGLVLGIAEVIPRGTEHPGEFANRLVATARSSCEAEGVVPIPLLGLSVRCGEQQRIEGPMPGVRAAQVAMRELRFSDDLRRVEIAGLDLSATRWLKVRLRADTARVAGLAPWSRSPRLSPLLRFGVLTALGLGLWLAAVLGFRVARVEAAAAPPRWQSLLLRLLLAAPGAVLAGGFIALDQDRAAPLTYVAALGGAWVTLGAVVLLLRRAPRILNSFQGF